MSADNSRAFGVLVPLLGVLATVAGILAIVLLAIGEPAFALSAAILCMLLAAAAAFDQLAARRQLARHSGDVHALDADAAESFPTMMTDTEPPLGATRESHSDLSPHDLPPAHPPANASKRGARRARPRDPSEMTTARGETCASWASTTGN